MRGRLLWEPTLHETPPPKKKKKKVVCHTGVPVERVGEKKEKKEERRGMNRRDRKEGLRGRVVGAEKNNEARTREDEQGRAPRKKSWEKKTRLGAGTVCSLVEY